MKYILGLDPGIASIGWAIVLEAENNQETSRIISSGVIKANFDNFTYLNSKGIPKEGNPVEMFRKGFSVSPNLVRRQSRSARRNLQHYKLRRADLIKLLKENHLVNDDTILYEEGKNTTHQTYELRAKAAMEEISLEELAKVLLMINKKRGYKSSRKEDFDSDEQQGEYLSAIVGRSKTLADNHQTVGQYLMNQLEQHPLKSIKNQSFYRKDYEDEFEQIWKTQIKFHPELTRKLKKELKNRVIFYQRPIESKKQDLSFCELESRQIEIEKNGKKRLVTTGSKVCPISSPLFQEFRMWHRLNDTVVINLNTLEKRSLTLGEKELLASELSIRKELSKKDVIKLLLGKGDKNFDLNFEKLLGNETQARLVNAYLKILELTGHDKLDIKKMKAHEVIDAICTVFANFGYSSEALKGQIENGLDVCQQPYYRLWHLLYSFPGDNTRSGNAKLIQRVKDLFQFDSDEFAKEIAEVRFPDGHGSLSAKAIQKILPKLKEGYQYSDACELVGYKHSKRSITKKENEQRVLQQHLKLIPHNSLRNPLVERILNQMVMLVNNLVDEYGKTYGTFDEIRIELPRELSSNTEKRQRDSKGIDDNQKEKETCREELITILKKHGIKVTYVSENDLLKYRLYKELEKNDFKTLYSNSKVDLIDLIMGRGFDKEHIIPRALRFDNSFSNLTIERTDINLDKSKSTAIDFIRDTYGEEATRQYIAKVNELFRQKAISKTKKENLLRTYDEIPSESLNRDLGLTAYINKKAMEILEPVTRKVVPTTGKITSQLRREWQIETVLKELIWDKYKKLGLINSYVDKNGEIVERINQNVWTKRSDHRNHAMDAITVAFTNPVFIFYLNSLNSRGEAREQLIKMRHKYMHRDEQGNWIFNPPMQIDILRAEVKQQLEQMLIFHQSSSKVSTPNVNITKSKKKKAGNMQQTLTPRGKLHDDTYYGCIQYPECEIVAVGKSFDECKIATVTKASYKIALLERLNQYGGNPKDAFTGKNALDKNPIWLDEMHTKSVPQKVKCLQIKTVYTKRVAVNENLNLENVVNEGIKRILKARLEAYNGKTKDAFTNLEENPIWFNKEKGICIKSVIVKATDVKDPIPLHKEKDRNGKHVIDDEGKSKSVDFVKPNKNHHADIYVDANGDLHEKFVTFFEAVQKANKNQPIVDLNYHADEGWRHLFSIQRFDYLVVPDKVSGFDPSAIDVCNPANYPIVSPHLFRVQKMSSKNYVLRQHLDTSNKTPEELKGVTSIEIRSLSNFLGCMKVSVNRLGRITSAQPIMIL